MITKKPEVEDLDKRIKILLLESYPGLLNELEKVGSTCNEFKAWTPLKLISLSYFVGPYLRIMGKQRKKYGPTTLFYIDLFAGSGINRVDKYLLAGSPIVAIDSATKEDNKFDYMFFVEADKNFFDSLRKRLEYLETYEFQDPCKLTSETKFSWISNRYEVICGDANQVIDKIVERIDSENYKHYLAFIDPFKWELKMKTIEKLLEIEYGDVFITLQATLTAKEIGKRDILTEKKKKEISDFLGTDEEEWSKLTTEESVKNYYQEKIRDYRKTILDITIRGKNFKYYLLFATRKEEPKWLPVIENLKNKIETFRGEIVEQSLKWLYGDIIRLTDFMED